MSIAEPSVTTDRPLSQAVLDYRETVMRLVKEAKQPGFTVDSWAPLARLIAVDEFERVGNFKERMNWPQYAAFLTEWASSAEYDSTVRRISEVPGLVFLELEERGTSSGHSYVINSVTVYEFNDAGKIRHLDVYLQSEPA
jgi:hypothetical protein